MIIRVIFFLLIPFKYISNYFITCNFKEVKTFSEFKKIGDVAFQIQILVNLNVCMNPLVIRWAAYWTKTKIRLVERHKWHSKRTVWLGWTPNFFNPFCRFNATAKEERLMSLIMDEFITFFFILFTFIMAVSSWLN